jgi:hypothetical protein
MIFGKTVVWENILKFRTFNYCIRTWVERSAAGPGHQEDAAVIGNWVAAHRQRLDGMDGEEVAKEMSKEFPRISAIEVMNGYGSEGCLLYPRWP